MKKALVYSIILFLLMTKSVSANVFFSEIAWMGTTVSSTNEWIELANDSDQSQNLDGWKIVSEDNNITINLSGSISPKGYYLIERTDDDSVPGIVADLVTTFGHGLSNAGETLYLKNDAGSTIESLSYTSGWPAGDVSTKDTMQKSAGTWITATPTPKTGGTVSQPTTASTTANTATGGGLAAPTNQVVSKKEPVLPKETIVISTPKSIAVNLPIRLSAKVFGSWSENITTGYFVWSMGDGKSFTANYLDKLTYHYEHAGTYIISLSYFVSKYQPEPTYVNSSTVVVSKNSISIIKDINLLRIKNSGEDDIDLSQFKIVDGTNTFVFPFGMKIVSNGEVYITEDTLGFVLSQPVLISKDAVMVASLVPVEIPSTVDTSTYVVKDPAYKQSGAQKTSTAPFDTSIDLNTLESDTQGANGLFASSGVPTGVIVVVLIILLVSGAFLMHLNKKENPSSDEFSLIDE